MATINQAQESNTTNGKATRHVTHFLNVSVVKNDGTTLKLGAISVYDGGDKVQRSLLAAIDAGQVSADQIALRLDVRENVKSTDTMDVSDWATVSVVEVEPAAAAA